MVMHWVLKYHRLFVSQPEFESGGALWVARFGIIECFLGALVLAQIIHIGVIGVKFGSSSSIKIGAAVVATGVSQVQYNLRACGWEYDGSSGIDIGSKD